MTEKGSSTAAGSGEPQECYAYENEPQADDFGSRDRLAEEQFRPERMCRCSRLKPSDTGC